MFNVHLFFLLARLRGIVGDANSVLSDPSIIRQVHNAGLLLFTYGAVKYGRFWLSSVFIWLTTPFLLGPSSDSDIRHKQKALGVDSVIVDNILKIGRNAFLTPRDELYWREAY